MHRDWRGNPRQRNAGCGSRSEAPSRQKTQKKAAQEIGESSKTASLSRRRDQGTVARIRAEETRKPGMPKALWPLYTNLLPRRCACERHEPEHTAESATDTWRQISRIRS